MPNKITSWLKSHVTQYKIDFMSLNRLRLNQTVSGQIPVTISLTEKTRTAENLLWARSHDASTSFESMELLLNPYGITPLTALCMFHFDSPDKILAYAGFSPSTYQSGQLDGAYSHMEKRGSRYLRYALYNAAKYVCNWDPTFAEYLAKKRAEGKHYNVAISHAVKKLVRVIYHLEKTNQQYIKAV